MKIFSTIAALGCFLASTSFAFDLYPEYQGPTSADFSRWSMPWEVGVDYQSGQLLTAYPDEEDPLTVLTTMGYNTNDKFRNRGYVNGWSFVQMRAQLTDDFSTHFGFRYTPFIQLDRQSNQERNVMEFVANANPYFSLSTYADPTFYDGGMMVGTSATIRMGGQELKFFRSGQSILDASHSLPNFGITHHSSSVGFVGGSENRNAPYAWAGNMYEYFFRYDLPSDRRITADPNGFFRYRYENRVAGVSLYHVWDRIMSSVRLQYGSTDQARGETLRESLGSRQTQAVLMAAFPLDMRAVPYATLDVQLGGHYREWINQVAAQATNFNFIPTVSLTIWTQRQKLKHIFYKLGFAFSRYAFWGDPALNLGLPNNQSVREIFGAFEKKLSARALVGCSLSVQPAHQASVRVAARFSLQLD